MKPRNAYCSFCRKSHTDAGPLVEGPGEVYICGECVELCQSIIDQERRRRNPSPSPPDPTHLRETLDKVLCGQDEAKQALVRAASIRIEGRGRVLLIGPSCIAKRLLARTLAHALEVPFAACDSSALDKAKLGTEDVVPLFLSLLHASDFNVEAAQQGVVYLGGVDRPEVQEALLQVWQRQVVEPIDRLQFNSRGVLFVCGGAFAELDKCIARSGRHLEQPVTAEALVEAGARPEWASHLAAIARAMPLDDETLTRMVDWVDFSRVKSESAEPNAPADGGA